MINSYQTKINTDSQNEANTIRGLRERLETALMPQPTMAIDDEPQGTLAKKVNDAIRDAASERDELNVIGQRAAQERDTKMNEEIQIARDRAHKGDALYERATLRDQEFDDVIRELAASRQKASDARSGYLNRIAEMAEEIKRDLFINWRKRTESWKMRTLHTTSWGWTPMIVDELY